MNRNLYAIWRLNNGYSGYFVRSEVAEQLGIGRERLKSWERKGFVKPIRAHNGWRLYNEIEVKIAEELVTKMHRGNFVADKNVALANKIRSDLS